MRCQLIAELSTNHGGDVVLAGQMIRDAAAAGADWVKTQAFSLERLNPHDPQADWLRQSHLDREDHQALIQVAKDAGAKLLSTPFDADSLQMLRDLGLTTFKIASSESGNPWWCGTLTHEDWLVSWPWGARPQRFPHFTNLDIHTSALKLRHLTAIPLYPTPLEAVGRAPLLDGWSDHCVGIDACLWAIAQGAQVLEVHFTNGQGRVCSWDKSVEQIRQLRAFAGACETMKSGVAEKFRERWRA